MNEAYYTHVLRGMYRHKSDGDSCGHNVSRAGQKLG